MRKLLLAAAVASLAVAGLTAPASGHTPATDWIGRTWGEAVIDVYIVDEASGQENWGWTTNKKTAIQDAQAEWETVSGMPSFVFHTTPVDFTDAGSCSAVESFGEDSIFFRPFDYGSSSVTADTDWCTTSGDLDYVFVNIDDDAGNSYEWYFPTGGDYSSSTETSFPGTMAHEFGHAIGFGAGSSPEDHFENAAACEVDTSDRPTMCSTYYLGGGGYWTNSTIWKATSIEPHDSHTAEDVY